MLAYTTLGVTDFERAKAFYEALLGVIGAQYVLGNERIALYGTCLLYTSPSPRDVEESRMPSSA